MRVADSYETAPRKESTETSIHLPLGLLGFEMIKRYELIAHPEEEPFQWLRVRDDPELAFLVVSPFLILPRYQPEVSGEDVEFLNLAGPDEALTYGIVTLRRDGGATVNLKGPIVLNRRTMIGKQVILANAAHYAVQHPISVGEPVPA